MKIGVLSLQGAFREHRIMMERCGAEVIEIRKPEELDLINGLILPGGESTTIGKLMVDWGFIDKIKIRAAEGMAIYATCAGMIVLSKDIIDSSQPRLGLLNAKVRRNAFGRQRESFEVDLCIPNFGVKPFPAVFIRAPYIESIGPEVITLATLNERIVFVRQGKLLATAFHPELTSDDRIHKYFLAMVNDQV